METTIEPIRRVTGQLVDAAPTVLLAVVVAVVGVLVSWVANRVARWIARRMGLETLGERLGASKLLYAVGFKRGLAELVGQIVLVAGLLLTFTAVAELSGLRGVAEAAAGVMAFLPRLLAAGAVLLGGFWFATVMREVVRRMGRKREDLESPELAGQIVYYAVAVVTVTLAADQAGIETDLVQNLVQIAAVCLLASFGLAFALGGRDTFRRVVAKHYVQRMVRVGDDVEVGRVTGRVVAFTPLSVVLSQADGSELLVPCDRFVDDVTRRGGTRE